jgi:uncharacterized membrane protein
MVSQIAVAVVVVPQLVGIASTGLGFKKIMYFYHKQAMPSSFWYHSQFHAEKNLGEKMGA